MFCPLRRCPVPSAAVLLRSLATFPFSWCPLRPARVPPRSFVFLRRALSFPFVSRPTSPAGRFLHRRRRDQSWRKVRGWRSHNYRQFTPRVLLLPLPSVRPYSGGQSPGANRGATFKKLFLNSEKFLGIPIQMFALVFGQNQVNHERSVWEFLVAPSLSTSLLDNLGWFCIFLRGIAAAVMNGG